MAPISNTGPIFIEADKIEFPNGSTAPIFTQTPFMWSNGTPTAIDTTGYEKPGLKFVGFYGDLSRRVYVKMADATAGTPQEIQVFNGSTLTSTFKAPVGVNSQKDQYGDFTGVIDISLIGVLSGSGTPRVAMTTATRSTTPNAYGIDPTTTRSSVLNGDGTIADMPTKMVYVDATYTAQAGRILNVSPDGNVVIGIATSGNPTNTSTNYRAYRYKVGSSQLDIIPGGNLTAPGFSSTANTSQIPTAMNRDGTVIAGASMYFAPTITYPWSTTPSTFPPSRQLSVDADRLQVARDDNMPLPSRAWIYDEVMGTRLASQVLAANGVTNLGSATINVISAMSEDGSTIAGLLTSDPSKPYEREGFVVRGMAYNRYLGAPGAINGFPVGYVQSLTVAPGETLRLGVLGGDTTGKLTVAAGGTLLLGVTTDQSSATNLRSIWGGDIAGEGQMAWTGAGNWIVSGSNSISGGVSLEHGTVTLQNGSFTGPVNLAAGATVTGSGSFGALTGTGTIDLTDAAAKIVVGAGDTSSALGATVTGAGTLEKTGTGTLAFSGVATGATALISGGALDLSGSWGGPLTVGSGALLTGGGTAGSITVQSGGTHAMSLGQKLSVTGDYTLSAGSTFLTQVAADGTNGKASVGGKVTLAGATLDVRGIVADRSNRAPTVADFPSLAYSYTLIENTGGQAVAGTFGTILTNLPFLTPSVTTEGNVVLNLERKTYLPQNPTAVEAALVTELDKLGASTLPEAQAIARELSFLPSEAAMREALSAISGRQTAPTATIVAMQAAIASLNQVSQRLGEVQTAMGSPTTGGTAPMAFAALSMPSEALGFAQPRQSANPLQRVGTTAATPQEPPYAVWAKAFGGIARVGYEVAGAPTSSRSGGFIAGADASVAPWLRLGFSGGFRKVDMKTSGAGSKTDLSGGVASVYAAVRFGNSFLNTSANFGFNAIDTSRTITVGGITATPRGSYRSTDTVLSLEGGHTYAFGASFIQPYVGLRYMHLRNPAYSETGSVLALAHRGTSRGTPEAFGGVKMATSLTLASMIWTPSVKFGVSEALGSIRTRSLMSLGSGSSYSVVGVGRDRTIFNLGAGLAVNIGGGAFAFADYTADLSKNMTSHNVQSGLRYRF